MKNKFLIIILALVLIITSIYFFCNFRTVKTSNQVNSEPNFTENTTANETNEPIVVEIPQKQDSYLKLTAIGDIMCHNSQYVDAYVASQNTYDFSYVFEDIKEYVSSADIAIGNLETTFAGPQKGYSNYPRFNTPEQLAANLKDFGIDILSTANNHSMDTNYPGVVSTLDYLDQAEISHVGTNRSIDEQNTILIKEVNDIKIAFLSFTYGTNGIAVPSDKNYSVNLIDEELILTQIQLAKAQNPDLICVNMHWGIEYQNTQNATQENLTNLLFQNGVDIILGSHPHVLQPMEKRSVVLDDGTQKDCFVIYSLGNFMSGQTKEFTRSSIILNIDILKNGDSEKTTIENISYVPIYTYKSKSGPQKYKVLDMAKAVSAYENGDLSIGEKNYFTLKSELERIQKMYENISN